MNKPDAILKPVLGVLHRERAHIVKQWSKAAQVQTLLARWQIAQTEFESTYASGILSHLLRVMEAQEQPGDCPTLAQLLERLAGIRVSVADIYTLCIQLRHTIADVVFRAQYAQESAGRYHQFLTALHRFFDANLSGVLERYYDTLLQKDQALARLESENKSQEQLLHLQARQATMGEMIGAIAHQWKQPLNLLALQVQDLESLFEEGALDGQALKATVKIVMDQVGYMSATIDDFRRFFDPSDKAECFQVSDAIDDAINLVGRQYKSRGIEIRFSGAQPLVLNGRRNDFVQVLLVLLSNAKDAIAALDKPGGSIEIDLKQAQGAIQLTVQDNGGGMPQGVLDKLFTPYMTTKKEGTGIGLYIARRIVEKMGGCIQAANRGEGAVFSLVFPAESKV